MPCGENFFSELNKKQWVMIVDFVTKEDLQTFRIQLLKDIEELLKPTDVSVRKPWLKNAEVRALLNISSNTLQRLRVAGKLPSTMVGGIHYYRFKDIERMMKGDEGKGGMVEFNGFLLWSGMGSLAVLDIEIQKNNEEPRGRLDRNNRFLFRVVAVHHERLGERYESEFRVGENSRFLFRGGSHLLLPAWGYGKIDEQGGSEVRDGRVNRFLLGDGCDSLLTGFGTIGIAVKYGKDKSDFISGREALIIPGLEKWKDRRTMMNRSEEWNR